MNTRDERKLECVIHMVQFAKRDGATVASIGDALEKIGFSSKEINAAFSYLAQD